MNTWLREVEGQPGISLQPKNMPASYELMIQDFLLNQWPSGGRSKNGYHGEM